MSKKTTERENEGIRVTDNYLTKVPNQAGCYCLRFNMDGEEIEVVVDEWFPFYIDAEGKEQFCFSRVRPKYDVALNRIKEDPELWVMLMEKAWAKMCGSYEASEMGTGTEAYNNIDGTPAENLFIAQFEKDNRLDELWSKLQEADLQNYPMSCQIDSNMRSCPETLKKFGLCDFHSYTVL